MTSIPSVARPAPVPNADGARGERLRRLQHRKRLRREKLLAALVLVVALAVTLTVLGLQWLGKGSSAIAARTSPPRPTLSGGNA